MLDLSIENHLPDCLIRKLKNVSGNINEAIRGNFRPFFFYKKILHIKKCTKCKQVTSIQMFLYAQKALKSKLATFTHKWHKK